MARARGQQGGAIKRIGPLVVLLAVALMTVGAQSAAAHPRLLVADYGTVFAVRPPVVTPSGDGSFQVGGPRRIHWKFWTKTKAYGVGTVYIEEGFPVATAPRNAYPGNISAHLVRNGRYTQMTVRWTEKGVRNTDAMRLKYEASSWVWEGQPKP